MKGTLLLSAYFKVDVYCQIDVFKSVDIVTEWNLKCVLWRIDMNFRLG